MSNYRQRILNATKRLVDNDEKIIQSYTRFDRGGIGWFFSKNSSLIGACGKPIINDNPANFKRWYELKVPQQHFFTDNGLRESNFSYGSLNTIKRILNEWPDNYYVVYYGGENNYSCNLFVGEVLYTVMDVKCMKNGKYYSAKDIWNATSPFTEVRKTEVVPGDIVAFNGSHVEIVSKVNQSNNSFCAIGCGRGSSPYSYVGIYSNGQEECGWTPPGLTNREIDNIKIKFLKIE